MRSFTISCHMWFPALQPAVRLIDRHQRGPIDGRDAILGRATGYYLVEGDGVLGEIGAPPGGWDRLAVSCERMRPGDKRQSADESDGIHAGRTNPAERRFP